MVFVSNYRVSYAEKLVAAADISEQISTAGTEASGTGNMKFMLNGAVTLGTLDGANVEIAEEAGAENEYIFGATVEELEKIMPDYVPRDITESDPKIKRVVSALIDGTVSDGGSGVFRELYFALMEGASWHVPDNYYLLGDLDSYVKAKLAVNRDYSNELAFAKKCWLNICSAGKFSSDRTMLNMRRIYGISARCNSLSFVSDSISVSFAVKRVIWIVTTFHRKRCHYPQKRQMVIGYYDKFTIVF